MPDRLKIAGLFLLFPILFPVHLLLVRLQGGSASEAFVATLEELPAAFNYVVTGR